MSPTTFQTLTLKLLIQGHLQGAKVPHIADFKSAYISVIIGPRGLQCETKLTGNHGLGMWSDLSWNPPSGSN